MNLPKPPAGVQVDRKKDLIILHSDSKYRIVESIGGYPVLMRATATSTSTATATSNSNATVAADTTSADIINNEGYLMTDANVRTIKARLAAFTAQPVARPYKRWGDVLRAYVKSGGKNTYTELVPYPRLRDILIELTAVADEGTPASVPEKSSPESEKSSTTASDKLKKVSTGSAEVKAPKKREHAEVSPVESTPSKQDAVPPKQDASAKKPRTVTPGAASGTSTGSASGTVSEHASRKRVKLESIANEQQLKNITNEQFMCVLGEYQAQPQECLTKYPFLLESSFRAYHAVKNYFVPT